MGKLLAVFCVLELQDENKNCGFSSVLGRRADVFISFYSALFCLFCFIVCVCVCVLGGGGSPFFVCFFICFVVVYVVFSSLNVHDHDGRPRVDRSLQSDFPAGLS